ncbi:MAG TPA: AAA family ATPase [Thermoanaerobaculia bacterium]
MSIFDLFRKKPDAAPPAPGPTSIYDYARQIEDRFNEVAHASELFADVTFGDAIVAIANSKLTYTELTTYALGENEKIASLAICALGIRKDEQAAEFLVEHLNAFYGNWPKFFALDALERIAPPPQPLLGAVFLSMNEDWGDGYSRFLTQLVRELAQRRLAGGEPPSFAGHLASASASQLDDVRQLLKRLDASIADPMRAELRAFERQSIDVEYLRHLGIIREDDDNGIVEHEALTAAANVIEQTVTAERRRSVIIVGEDGVGKSTVLRAASKRLREQGWVIFEAGATELVAGQSYIGQLEKRLQKLIGVLRNRRVLWIIPRFHELQHAGSHRYSPVGILDTLLPELDSGAIVIVGETSTTALQKVVEQKRRVATAVLTLRIEPSDDSTTLDLARRWTTARGASLSNETLAEAWQLTLQFLGMRAAPGNLLGLLERTLARLRATGEAHVELTLDDLLVTLSQLTGLPNSILDEREGLDLHALREHFTQRVLGQPEAIDVLVERVAMIKAGVTDPTRPFGVFLFAGPTGTGKTEIAKALAGFLFGSSDRMIRLDMSELKTHESIARLIGDDDRTSTSLVDSIRKQPFSVVLLDEFEKAHPNVWDLFLQVFDDGRLTDRRGETADFRHALIIMTSNIGAAIQTHGRVGFSDAGGGFAASNVKTALEREFRKEFINRIDRVVVFRPLTRETMRGILRKELAEAFKRRGLRNRNWAVEWDESALELLLTDGFTEDLGARPLKRAVERQLLTPLAEMIVTRRVPTGDQFLFIRAEDRRLVIDFVDPDAPQLADAVVAAPAELSDMVLAARGGAEEVERLHAEYTRITAIVNGSDWSERKQIALQMTALPEFWSSAERFEILGEAEARDRVESALAGAGSLLDRLRRGAPAGLVRRLAQLLWLIGIAIDDLKERRPSEALLVIEGENPTWTARIATMYRQWAKERGMRVDEPTPLTLAVSGFGAHTLLAPEAGLHVLEVPSARGSFERVTARVRVAPITSTADEAARALATTPLETIVVRRYRDEPSALVRDSVRNWRSGRVDVVLAGNFDVMR